MKSFAITFGVLTLVSGLVSLSTWTFSLGLALLFFGACLPGRDDEPRQIRSR